LDTLAGCGGQVKAAEAAIDPRNANAPIGIAGRRQLEFQWCFYKTFGPTGKHLAMLKLNCTREGIILRLKVVPGSSRDRIVGELGDVLKVAVTAPPEKGKANKAVVRLLAKALNLAAGQIEVLTGHGSPNKGVLIRGATPEAIQSLAGA
jgi:uncharacterized protein (TIGR00251 family)